MLTHSSILAQRIPHTEEPGGLHTVHGSQRVGHDCVTKHTHSVSLHLTSRKPRKCREEREQDKPEGRGLGEERRLLAGFVSDFQVCSKGVLPFLNFAF